MDSTGFHFSDAFIAHFSDRDFRQDFVADQVRLRIATMVRSLREQRGWSQQELAERLGTTQTTVSRIENPDYGKLSLSTLLSLAAAFDLPLWVEMPNWRDWLIRNRNFTEASFQQESFRPDALNPQPASPIVLSSTSALTSSTARAQALWGAASVFSGEQTRRGAQPIGASGAMLSSRLQTETLPVLGISLESSVNAINVVFAYKCRTCRTRKCQRTGPKSIKSPVACCSCEL